MSEWISVNERTPEDLKMVLIWRERTDDCQPGMGILDGYCFGWHEKNYKWYAGDHGSHDAYLKGWISITHWSYLPEPPND